jgi:hypothetical protein
LRTTASARDDERTMATTSLTEHRTYGRLVLERLDAVTIPAVLKPRVATFKKTHDAYEAAALRADDTRAKRDAALDAVGDADDVFDPSINDLANKMAGAGLGSRQNPFKGLSPHSPSQLTSLPYAEEPKALRALADAVLKKKPPSDVAKAISACLKNASALEAALAKLVQPQAAYSKALADRDALLPAWSKALRTLKKHAAAAWDEDPSTYKAIFAPAEAVQAPRKKRPAKKTAAPVTKPA